MTVFLSTINQMSFLILMIAIGYLLFRLKLVPKESAEVLSKLENNVLIPALAMGTFLTHFTPDSFREAGMYLLAGTVLAIVSALFAVVVAKFCTKDHYIRKIYTYGLSFSNFGFMGNAVVGALFPNVFMNYLVFVIPSWVLIYVWGVPALLMPESEEKGSLLKGLKKLCNPMFGGMLIGMILGITSLSLPSFLSTTISTLGSCMSPVAMLLTGITIARIDLLAAFKNASVYLVSFIRLVLMPLVGIALLLPLSLPYGIALCCICALAMPLGLNTIVVPSAYGKDPTVAAQMALISHLLSCLTIPLVFMLFNHLFA
jgi:predicted permease